MGRPKFKEYISADFLGKSVSTPKQRSKRVLVETPSGREMINMDPRRLIDESERLIENIAEIPDKIDEPPIFDPVEQGREIDEERERLNKIIEEQN